MSTLAAVRSTFRDLARTIVAGATDLDEPGWADLEAIVEGALAVRPPAVRRQLATFIRLLNVLPLFRYGRTFRALDPARRARFLRGVQDSRLFLLRRGFWGLRSLVFMGYYARPAAYRAVGYDARLRGWLEHPDATDAARRATLAAAGRTAPGAGGPGSAGGSEGNP